MSGAPLAETTTTATALRRAFDDTFSAPLAPAPDPGAEFMSVRVGGETCAIALASIRTLLGEAEVAPCPSDCAEFLGLAGRRGVLIAVYDLAALLGRPASGGRWLMVAGDGTVAFACDAFEGRFRVPAGAHAQPADQNSGGPFAGIVQHGAAGLPVIDLAAVIAGLAARFAHQDRSMGEH